MMHSFSMFRLLVTNSFIFLFVYTALSKLLDIKEFIRVLQTSPVADYSTALAYILPVLLLMIALLIIIRRTNKWGMYGATFLLVALTGYTAYVMFFVKPLPCSCGGITKQLTWNQQFILNVFLTALAVASILLPDQLRSKSRKPDVLVNT